MAKRAVKVRECDRCPGHVPAEHTEELRVGGEKYRLDLCQRHYMELDRMLYGWARLGELVEEPHHRRFNEHTIADAVRLAELRDKQREEVEAKPQTVAIRLVGDALVGLPADAGEWIFTEHAMQRMRERNISAARALKAACDPHTRREGRNGAVIHVRDHIKAIVNDVDKTILTVAREDVETWSKSS